MDNSTIGTCPIHRWVQIFATTCWRTGEAVSQTWGEVLWKLRFATIVMAVAGITAHRLTDLVFVNGTLNVQKYRQDILARHVVSFIRVLFSRMTPVHTLHGTIWTIWGAITLMCYLGQLYRQICHGLRTYWTSWIEWFVNVNSSPRR